MISLLRFLAPFLRKGELGETTRAIHLGTQRILLVLLHDFPDFLSQAAFALCDAIPTQCIQLHNLILSAFPLSSTLVRLPDPLQVGLQINLLPEINTSPQILTDYALALTTAEIRAPLDKYLQTRSPVSLPVNLRDRLLAHGRTLEVGDPKYNVPLINSLVLYLGVVALNQSKAQSGVVTFVSDATSTALLRSLIDDIEPEGVFRLVF
jgi:CCR4-NOT transcription complex subunit 1